MSAIRRINHALGLDIRRGKTLKPNFEVNDRSSAPGTRNELLPGWREAQSGDGRTYFYNEAGETRWDRPAAVEEGGGGPSGHSSRRGSNNPGGGGGTALAVMQKPIIPNVAGIGKLPRGWRLITGADGKPYYWHKKTGEARA